MGDIRREGKQVWGPNGEHGYDQGNRIDYNGKTYYKDANGKSFYCPEDGKTYHTDGYNVWCPNDGMHGVITNTGFHVNEPGKNKTEELDWGKVGANSNGDRDVLMLIAVMLNLIKIHWKWPWFFMIFIAFLILEGLGMGMEGLPIGMIVGTAVYFPTKPLMKKIRNKVSGKVRGLPMLVICILAILYFGMSVMLINENLAYIRRMPIQNTILMRESKEK